MRQLNQVEEAFTIVNSAHKFTLVCALRLNRSPSPETLRSALRILQSEYPLFAAFVEEKKKHYWFVNDKEAKPIPLELIVRKDENHWEEVARAELNKTFDHRISPLVRGVYLPSKSAEGESEIFLSFHHSVIDAASFLPVVERFLDLAGRLEESEDKNQDKLIKQVSHLPLLKDVLPGRYKGLRFIFKLIPFMARQMSDERKYKKAAGDLKDIPVPESSDNGFLRLELSENETEKLVKWTRSKRLTINSTLTAAMLKAVNEHRYGGKRELLRAVQFANLRPYLKPPVDENGAGCFVAMMRSTARLSPYADIARVAAFLDQQFSKAAKRGDKFLYALLSKMLVKSTIKANNARLGAAALSYAGAIKLKEQYEKIRLNGIHASISNNSLGAEITAFAKIYRKRLSMDLNYLLVETSSEFAKLLVADIRMYLLQTIDS